MRCWFSLACATDNAIGDAGASVIADALNLNPSVTSVDLSCESALCQRAHVGFVTVTCVVGFHACATDNAIGDAGASVIAEALKRNTTITSVDLSSELAHA